MGAGLDFTELRLMTDAPYFRVKGVQYNGQIKFSNFPVSLDSISIAEIQLDGQSCIGLAFNLKVNIAQGKITGGTRLLLASYYDKPPGDAEEGNWKFYKLKIYEIHIGAEFSKLKVAGKILFIEDDPVYGNAFYGSVMINFVEKFTISSSCMFGAASFRYWYIDARIDLPTAITVVGPFMLNGFGGGVYSRMTKAPRGSMLPYVPDSTSSFGVKALVAYVVAKKEVCKGDLMFEINFNTSGGVKYIAFYGNAEIVAGGAIGGMLAKLNQLDAVASAATNPADAAKIASGNVQDVAKSTNLGPPPASSIFAFIGIQYNFETATLEANSEVYINLGVLRGIGANNRAGWMELHVSPGRWYCYAGTPEDRMGIVLSIAGVKLSTGSYFMVGTEMPTFPDPPADVVRILGPELYPVKNNISQGSLQTGSGFAFGLDINLKADINFMILYANMNAGVGGDLMLRQYPDAHCQGSSEPLGINNWYANGRVYTYLEGEIGVKVDLMFIHAKIPIINGAAAALLEGGGPKPTWARGYLRVCFSVLGGKISGDMKMKMSLGEECVIVTNSNAPISFKVISDISPAANATEVDVFTAPQIVFNVAVNEPFEVTDDNGTKLFRVKLSSLQVSSNGNPVVYTKVWTNKNQTLTLTPENTLPSQQNVDLVAKVEFEIFQNNGWSAYTVKGVSPSEIQTVSFKTSVAPTNIPYRNVAYMYPAHEQKNIYRSEGNKGYVVLKQWQDYLLDGDTKTNKFVKLVTADGKQTKVLTPTLNRSTKKIEFDISSLQTQTTYNFTLVTLPIGDNSLSADTVSQSYGDDENGQYQLTENKAQSVLKGQGENILLPARYTTSTYNTLAEKINVINASVSNKLVYLASYDYLNVRTRSYEVFDSTELFGSAYTNNVPLITYQSLLTDAYYQNEVFPKIYKDFPYRGASGISIRDRDVNQYGFPPARAIYHDPEYELDAARMPYIDALADVYRRDYHDLENQLMNQYVNGNWSLLNLYPQYFRERFPEAPLSNVDQIEFKYLMPGAQAGTKGVVNYRR